MQVQGAFAPGGAQSPGGRRVRRAGGAGPLCRGARHAVETTPAQARALAKPPVRKLAKDLGVDLAS